MDFAFDVVVLRKPNLPWGYSEPRIGGGIRGDHVSDVAGCVPPWCRALRKLSKLEKARLETVSVVCLWLFFREKIAEV